MKKKLSYRDKLIELAYIYDVKEIKEYQKSRKNLTTGQLELILKKNKIIIPKDFKSNFFKDTFVKPSQGCDAVHLFYGGDPFSGGTIGCAFVGAICDSWSFGVNQIGWTGSLALQAVLVAHELGHNLDAGHVSGDDRWIMEPYISNVDSFKPKSIRSMNNFVSAMRAEDPYCTVGKCLTLQFAFMGCR